MSALAIYIVGKPVRSALAPLTCPDSRLYGHLEFQEHTLFFSLLTHVLTPSSLQPCSVLPACLIDKNGRFRQTMKLAQKMGQATKPTNDSWLRASLTAAVVTATVMDFLRMH